MDGPRTCIIWTDPDNVVGWTQKMYRDAPTKRIGMDLKHIRDGPTKGHVCKIGGTAYKHHQSLAFIKSAVQSSK
eukprot:5138817-Karenia_brevis.AAC.1